MPSTFVKETDGESQPWDHDNCRPFFCILHLLHHFHHREIQASCLHKHLHLLVPSDISFSWWICLFSQGIKKFHSHVVHKHSCLLDCFLRSCINLLSEDQHNTAKEHQFISCILWSCLDPIRTSGQSHHLMLISILQFQD